MIDKSFYAAIFVYACSFAILGVQYSLADVFGLTLMNKDGEPIVSNILVNLHVDTINSVTSDLVGLNDTRNDTLSAIENSYNISFNWAWELALILTGTYIFYILVALGVDVIWVAGLVAIYLIFLFGRTVIALIRGL